MRDQEYLYYENYFWGDRPWLVSLDLQGTAEDYLLAGTDTTSITTAMILYHISRNPEVQDKILTEINSVLEPGQDPSAEVLNCE